MDWLTHRRYALYGAFACVLAAVLGQPYGQVIFQIAAAGGVLSVVIGLRRYQPRKRATWIFMAATCATFFISYGARAAIPGWWPHSLWEPTPADFLDLLGVALAVVGFHRAGQVRDRYRDPTTVVDALVLTGGLSAVAWMWVILPYARDDRFSEQGRILQVVACVLALWLAFVGMRLAMGPGAKTLAFRPLGLAAALSMASQVAGSAGTGAEDPLCVALGAAALICVGVTALHPSMAAVTESSAQGVAKMSGRRLALMGLAVFTAPAILLYEAEREGLDKALVSGLIGSWIIVTLLVLVRFAGLVRARERVAQDESALRKAAVALATATDRRGIYEASLQAIRELVNDETGTLRVSMLFSKDDHWEVADSVGFRGEDAMGRTVDREHLPCVTDAADGEVVTVLDSIPADLPAEAKTSVTAAPLLLRGSNQALMLVSSTQSLSQPALDGLRAVALDTSMALEAILLSEDLHRRQSEARLQALVQHSSDIIAVIDIDGLIKYVTPSVATVLERDPEELTGTDLTLIVHPEDREVINQLVMLMVPERSSSKHMELRVSTPKGEWKTLDVTLTDLRREPSINGLVINAHDVSERKALEQDLRHKVLHDDLTGIANRVLFVERLNHALTNRFNNDRMTAVLFIDLDDFKTLNDGLGHGAGDELLKIIAFRIESFVRSGDTAARFGGDEFAVLFEQLHTADDIMSATKRLLEVVQQPVDFAGREIHVSASIGVALADEKSTSEVLLRNADVAMYHAKQTGKSRIRMFDDSMYERAFERLELKAELQHALERNELALFYQPLVSLADQHLVGFEALMRWIHPSRGFIPPDTFIPLSEETGLIVEIGAWALKTATLQLAEWRRNMPGIDIGMSVNVSPRQLEEDSIIEDVRFAIQGSGIEPSWLTLELTEGSGLNDPMSRERLIALHAMGCGIAADDFGTGFASYAALQQLPFTNVKIDRSLITGLASNDPRPQAQVRSIIQMGHAIGVTITAEGIEETRQRDALAAMGADKGQGYLFSRPVPAAEASELVVSLAQGATKA